MDKDRLFTLFLIFSCVIHGVVLAMSWKIVDAQGKEASTIPDTMFVVQVESSLGQILPSADKIDETQRMIEHMVNTARTLVPFSEPHSPEEHVSLNQDMSSNVNEKSVFAENSSSSDAMTVLAYQDVIKQKIQSSIVYPSWAIRQGVAGIASVCFIVDKTGMIKRVGILHSSGQSSLDQEAIAAVRRAQPLPPFPSYLTVSSLEIEVEIVFNFLKR